MRVLIANHRYFVASGIERYLFNVTEQLERAGHTVLPFAIDYEQNQETPYSKYFASPIGARDEPYFSEHAGRLSTWPKSVARLFYSREVETAVARMIEDTRPDIAYVLYYLRKLSPSLLVGIKKQGIPLVVRLSDFGMFCAEHHCLRQNRPCTLCKDRSVLRSVRYRCVRNSVWASAMDAVATGIQRWRGYFDLIDKFVVTNEFMLHMMRDAGFAADRLVCIPTFTDPQVFRPSEQGSRRDYLVYAGRLVPPKGIEVLIDAIAILNRERPEGAPTLKIAGEGHDHDYLRRLKAQIVELGLVERVLFTGNVCRDEMIKLYQGALCSVLPMHWFENLPNSLIESLACGTPVVASDIGSLAMTLTDGKDALLFTPGDAQDLARKISAILDETGLRERLGANGRATALRRFSPDAHLQALLSLFERSVATSRLRSGAAQPIAEASATAD